MFNPIRIAYPHFIFDSILKCEMELKEINFFSQTSSHTPTFIHLTMNRQGIWRKKDKFKKNIITVYIFLNLWRKKCIISAQYSVDVRDMNMGENESGLNLKM